MSSLWYLVTVAAASQDIVARARASMDVFLKRPEKVLVPRIDVPNLVRWASQLSHYSSQDVFGLAAREYGIER